MKRKVKKRFGKDARYKMFAEAMDQYSRLAKIALEALQPYVGHSANCPTFCTDCRLEYFHRRIQELVTVNKFPQKRGKKKS